MRRLLALGAVGFFAHCSLLTDLDGIAEGTRDAGIDASAGVGGGGAGGSSGQAGSGAVDAVDDSDGAGGAPVDASNCDASTLGADYELRQLSAGTLVSVDGLCDESFWAELPSVPFSGFKNSDNTGSCRFAWAEGTPSVQYGCCEIADKDLHGTVVGHDDEVFKDDSVEMIFKSDTERKFDAAATKVFVNVLGTVKDLVGPFPPGTDGYDAQVDAEAKLDGTLDDGGVDTSYTLEWRANLGFEVSPPQLGLCQFMVNDRDVPDAGPVTRWIAFNDEVNNPDDWGTCAFSCNPPNPL